MENKSGLFALICIQADSSAIFPALLQTPTYTDAIATPLLYEERSKTPPREMVIFLPAVDAGSRLILGHQLLFLSVVHSSQEAPALCLHEQQPTETTVEEAAGEQVMWNWQ